MRVAVLFGLLSAVLASNADNYFCRSCGVLMEAVHDAVVAKTSDLEGRISAGESASVPVDVKGMVDTVCTSKEFRATHSPFLVDGCVEITRKNAAVVAAAFGGDVPTPANTYGRTLNVCVSTMDLCDSPEVVQAPLSPCEACLAAVQDLRDVLLRRKGRPGYRTRRHVSDTLDDVCQHVPMRFVPDVAPAVQAACEELVANHEDEVLHAFVGSSTPPGKALCGSAGMAVCSNRKQNWAGHRSPWSRVPKYSTKEHDEL